MKPLSAVMLCFSVYVLSVSTASAVDLDFNGTIKDDLNAGLSLETAVRGAVLDGSSIGEAISEAMEAAPGRSQSIIAAAFSIAPDQAADIVEAAIRQGMSPTLVVGQAVQMLPSKTAAVVARANKLAPEQTVSITQAAIIAGADPTMVAGATASGSFAVRRARVSSKPPGLRSRGFRPPVVPPVRGGRGGRGGVASPS